MREATARIQTTHCGSLARPADLLDAMRARAMGARHDAGAYARQVQRAVADVVAKQIESASIFPPMVSKASWASMPTSVSA